MFYCNSSVYFKIEFCVVLLIPFPNSTPVDHQFLAVHQCFFTFAFMINIEMLGPWHLRHANIDSDSVFGVVGFVVDAKVAVCKLHLCNILVNFCNIWFTRLASVINCVIPAWTNTQSCYILYCIYVGLSLFRDRFDRHKQVHWEVCEQNWTVSWFSWYLIIGEECSKRCEHEAWKFAKNR